jgi:Mor family transcriptional regulator
MTKYMSWSERQSRRLGGMKRNIKAERNNHIYQSRVDGMSYRKIAEAHGISIIRVRQIIEAESRKKALEET